jgi:hypothetical protein
MSQRYILNDQHPIPAFLVWLIASWATSLAAFTGFAIAVWVIWGNPDHNLLDAFPGVVSILFGVWGVYTGAGALLLWVTMWVYWGVFERRSFGTRMGWFFTLLFGVYYGALLYAFVLWRKGAVRSIGSTSEVSAIRAD